MKDKVAYYREVFFWACVDMPNTWFYDLAKKRYIDHLKNSWK